MIPALSLRMVSIHYSEKPLPFVPQKYTFNRVYVSEKASVGTFDASAPDAAEDFLAGADVVLDAPPKGQPPAPAPRAAKAKAKKTAAAKAAAGGRGRGGLAKGNRFISLRY